MTVLDWAIVALLALGVTAMSVWTKRYLQGVSDFLSGGRSAGRYLFTTAWGMSGTGVLTVVAMFESIYAAGVPIQWWQILITPIMLTIAMTGWIYYRFRETRCMTVAQFYEVRYSKGVRICAGIITFLSGIVNFGIFPAVAATFFVYFCALPLDFVLGGVTIPTFAPVMIVTLGAALLYTCLGGQITVMVTDAVQGIFCGVMFLVVCCYLLAVFRWADVERALVHAPEYAARDALLEQADNLRRKATRMRAEGPMVRPWERASDEAARSKVDAWASALQREPKTAVGEAEKRLARAEADVREKGKSQTTERAVLTGLAAVRTAKLEVPFKQAEAVRLRRECDLILQSRAAKAGAASELKKALREFRAEKLQAEAQLAERKADDEIIVQADALGKSMLDPFDTGKVEHFNVSFFLIQFFMMFYTYMSWQGTQAYFSSSLNPHEQEMGQIIAFWRMVPQTVMLLLIPLCAIAFLQLPQYASQAEEIRSTLRAVGSPTEVAQASVSLVLAYMLPAGLKGAFCAVMLCFLITTQDTYPHSWGTIFVQDVVLPFQKKPMGARSHVWFLRCSIVGVGVFAFLWSLLFTQTEYIWMYLAITSAIIAGLGAMIIGGLYWKWGGTLGAYVAMFVGIVLASGRQVNRIVLRTDAVQSIEHPGTILKVLRYVDSVNAQWARFWIVLICIALYVVFSLLTRKKPFNMERMLHRGEYAIEGEHVGIQGAALSLWNRMIGITEEFTFCDRMLAYSVIGWNLVWVGALVLGSLGGVFLWQDRDYNYEWAVFWEIWMWTNLFFGVPATIWVTIGSIIDIRRFFRRLATMKRDEFDDGRVVHPHVATEPDEENDKEDER